MGAPHPSVSIHTLLVYARPPPTRQPSLSLSFFGVFQSRVQTSIQCPQALQQAAY